MSGWTFANGEEIEDFEESLVVSDGGEDGEQRRRHADEWHSQRMAQARDRHAQVMRHADDLHRQHLKHRDELHKHNISLAKAHKKHLGEAYLYGGGMAYNEAPDGDADDAAPDTGTASGATTDGAGSTGGVGGTV